MKKNNIESLSGQTLFVGIDVHKKSFHVTLRTNQIRMGHITRTGKADLRGMLVEAAWILVRKDPYFKKKYKSLLSRVGQKRAIVAIARKLVILARRLVLDQTDYQPPLLKTT